ncbi:MAG: glucose-6-phosphate dehydrogenase, partial [Acidobacteria bacterium]|nr:glucose-6-phosphate dehydrogenase [Acidobacteriota bacterium]
MIENPLREGLRLERIPEPCTMVIFGASGDLTKRKLVPALYSLAQQSLLPGGFSIVGAARTPMSSEDFRARMKEAVHHFLDPGQVDSRVLENCAAGMFYTPIDVKDPGSFKRLSE